MSKEPLVSTEKESIKKIKAKLSSEIGMEFNDEIYKGRKTLLNRYVGLNFDEKLIKSMLKTFERKFKK